MKVAGKPAGGRFRPTRTNVTSGRRLRVLSALVLREMATRYGKSNLGYFWAVVEPVAYVAIFSVLFSYLSRHPPLGQSFPVFFATGVMVFFFYRGLADTCASAFSGNRALFSYPQVTLLDSILARAFLEFVTRSFVAMIVLVGVIHFAGFESIYAIGPILLAPLICGATGFGAGLINCVLFNLSNTYQRLYMVVTRPMMIISGVIFIPERLPAQGREVILWNPLVHMVAYFRTGFYPTYRADYINFTMMIGLPLVLIVVGLFLIRRFEGRLQ
ncbi:MAG: ABC transporter permease [Pikeienuella sp.]